MYQRLYFSLIICLLMLFTACHRNHLGKLTRGMSVYGKQEFWYTLHSADPHAYKPQVGDQLRIDYSMRKGDKILNSSYKNRRPTLVQIPQPRYDNFFTKALKLMSEGDSLVVVIDAEKARHLLGDYDEDFEDGDPVTFTYKLQELKTAQEFEDELRAELARIEQLKKVTTDRVLRFKEGELRDSIETTEAGLGYMTHQKGQGPKAETGSLVQVHYVCFLPDGTELQDSYRDMNPLEFVVGDNTVIDGWSQGIALMHEGGKATLFIPPFLGYGAKGVKDVIPPNSTLIFYVELLSVE